MDGGEADFAVVGAGILGLAVARELLLRRPGARVRVLEREASVGAHQTGHSSGVVHAGIYYPPGSLKARLCVEGARLLYELCERHGVPHERCGKVIVALSDGELPRLDELERRGHANGVPGLRRLDGAGLRELEPHCRGVAALHSPGTGIVDFAAVARALAGELRDAGGELVTGCDVRGVRPIARGVRSAARGPSGEPVTGGAARGVRSAARGVELEHAGGVTRARHAIFCAGAWADRLAQLAGAPADPRIVPFRGGYLRLRPEARGLVRSLIYPLPDPELPFLGVHLTRHIDGEVLLGPTALLVGARDAYRLRTLRARDVGATLAWPGTWRMARRFWRTGLSELRLASSRRAFVRACARYVPELSADDVLPGPAGVRAQAVARDGRLVDDFVLSEAGATLHVRNAPSPAATSSLALAALIADRAEAAFGP